MPARGRERQTELVDEVSAGAVAWIRRDTTTGRSIRSALPAGFEVYGLLDYENSGTADENDRQLLDALEPDGQVQLIAGWLITSSSMTEPGSEHTLYANWLYRLRHTTVATIRNRTDSADRPLPDLLFPADHSWLISTLWDDSWRSIGLTRSAAERLELRIASFVRINPHVDVATTGREVR